MGGAMIKKLSFILPFVFLALLYANVSKSEPQERYSKAYFFGDSLVDAQSSRPNGVNMDRLGNNFWGPTEEGAKVGAPYTSSIGHNGRNRPIWVNSIVNHLRLRTSPEVVPSRIVQELQEQNINMDDVNVDYAYAAATTGNNFVNDLDRESPIVPIIEDCVMPGLISEDVACVPGLLKQLELYLQDSNYQADPDGLYFLWAGANDIGNGATLSVIGNDPDIAIKVTTEAATNVLLAIGQLITAGANAENIVVFDMPDLGLTPGVVNDADTSAALTGLSRDVFNAILSGGIAEQFPNIQQFSAFDFLNAVIDDPKSFHFTNVTEDCVFDGDAPQCRVGNKRFFFWDNKHPTSDAHQELARAVADSLVD